MTEYWSKICVALLLLVFLHRIHSFPSQSLSLQENEEEDDSLELQFQQLNKVISNHIGIGRNASNQEIVDKTSTFLSKYFPQETATFPPLSRTGENDPPAQPSPPSLPPPKQNKTIYITLVKSKTQPGRIKAANLTIEKQVVSRVQSEVVTTQAAPVQQQITFNADGSLQVPAGQKAPIIVVKQFLPPAQQPSTTPKPTTSIFGQFSKIFGSVAEGNFGNAITNTFKLAEVPLIQDTVNGVLHSFASGVSSSVSSGIASSITSGLTAGVTSEIADIVSDPSLGGSSNVASGFLAGVGCQVLGNCPSSSNNLRNSPEFYRSEKKDRDKSDNINNLA